MIPSPQEAYELLKQYNSDPFHLAHGRIVGEGLALVRRRYGPRGGS